MSKTRVLMVRTLAVVVGSIAVVGLFVTGYVSIMRKLPLSVGCAGFDRLQNKED